jgi:hypothetical protein
VAAAVPVDDVGGRRGAVPPQGSDRLPSHYPPGVAAASKGTLTLMAGISLSVAEYDPTVGVVAPGEGGTVTVEIVNGAVEIFGNPAGLRDLARLCLVLSDPRAPRGAHIHFEAGIGPLDLDSASLMLARDVESTDI